MRRIRTIALFFVLITTVCLEAGCSDGKDFSTTYRSHFFGLYKPKAHRPSTPQRAFATGFRGSDPFSKHKRKHKYNIAGDGYHTVVRHMRKQNSMGRPGQGHILFFKTKSKHRHIRSTAREDKRIFGKYQHKSRKHHGKR